MGDKADSRLNRIPKEDGRAYGGGGSTFNERHNNNGYNNKAWGYTYSYQTEEGEDRSN